MSTLFIAGLPFGASFWTDTQQRLDTQNIESHTWTLCANAGSIQHQVAELHRTVEQLNISCIVGHGLALPLILNYAHQHPTEQIILSNGMLTSNVGLIKWLLPRMTSIPSIMGKFLLSPALSIPLMASSACFRRLVVNPYVMSKEVIKHHTNPQLMDAQYIQHVMEYLESLTDWKCPSHLHNGQVHLIWGENDPVFPVDQVQYINHIIEHAPQHTHIIPGGAHFHPVERPWGIADIIINCLTSMS